MSFLEGLRRAWVTIQVPGTPVERVLSTYFEYAGDRLPTPPADVGRLAWLEAARSHPEAYLGRACSWAEQDLTLQGVQDLLGATNQLPDDFAQFLRQGLRDRLRSATDCYFDLGNFAVDVAGGRLLHLVSDSQWVYHWLLYIGTNGDSGVVGTALQAGFTLDAEKTEFWETEGWSYTHVADSFAEFAWRWWMDNEIFYRVKVDKLEMTDEQRRYVAAYGSA